MNPPIPRVDEPQPNHTCGIRTAFGMKVLSKDGRVAITCTAVMA